jgi:predicted lactoylglutathione lyase
VRQSVSLVTLGVADYGRAKAFYEALGWSVTWEAEETAFFQANGVVLVLWSREKLAADMGIADEAAGWGGIALAHNVGSRAEVDEVVELARSTGAEVTRVPAETFYGGYAGRSGTSTATSGRSRTTRASASTTTGASRSLRSWLSSGDCPRVVASGRGGSVRNVGRVVH